MWLVKFASLNSLHLICMGVIKNSSVKAGQRWGMWAKYIMQEKMSIFLWTKVIYSPPPFTRYAWLYNQVLELFQENFVLLKKWQITVWTVETYSEIILSFWLWHKCRNLRFPLSECINEYQWCYTIFWLIPLKKFLLHQVLSILVGSFQIKCTCIELLDAFSIH